VASGELTKARQPTPSQRWCMEAGLLGEVRGGYGGPSVINSFTGAPTAFGHLSRVVNACEAAGWLANGRTTDAGRAALTKQEERDGER
jgi:hypothetical protein